VQFTPNQKKAHDLNRHISVTAGAGSGKTAVLVNRYLKILLEKDVRPNQVVAITFTEKAAAELKGRIVREINARLSPLWSPVDGGQEGADNRARLEAIKEGLTSAQISTIHSFCARILREYPVEAGVDAGFSVLHGLEQRLLLRATVDSTLRSIAALPNLSPFPSPLGEGRKGRGWEDTIRENLAFMLRIFGKKRLEEILLQLVYQRDALDRLTRDLYSRTDQELLDDWREFTQAQLAQSLKGPFPVEQWASGLNRMLAVVKGKNAARVRELTNQIQPHLDERELTLIFSEISGLIVTKGGAISKQDFLGRGVKTDGIETEIDFLVKAANHFQSLPSLTEDDALLIGVTRPLLAIYQQIQYQYELRKAQGGHLDFEDLQLKVRNLLQHEPVRERLAQKYPYIMVDEYQDTNRLQYEILKPLISDFQSGNLFIVGDQKQSIYGFRRADVRVFHRTLKEMTAYQEGLTADLVWGDEKLQADESEKRGEFHLPENFRLLRNLVGFVNLVFQPVMGAGASNEFEVAYEPLIKGRANDEPGDVEIIIGSKEGGGKDSGFKIQDSLNSESRISASPSPCSENDLIVARIRHLIGTKATVWERGSEEEVPRAIRYGDIAILIRSRTRLPEIESALLKANIPYKITGGIGFYQRQEIYDICNYLQFLVNPEDNVALAGVLRAPFFGISDVELYEISQQPVSGSFWQKVQTYAAYHSPLTAIDNRQLTIDNAGASPSPSPTPICYAVQTLQQHLEICNRLPISALTRKIVNDTGMIGVLPVGKQGEQKLANYEKLLSVARDFENVGFTDLFDFLERLNLLIEEEEREGQAETLLTSDAVQVMTVHAAKGLEFPVVILPFMERKFKYDQEPFIDDALGIGFSPLAPEKNYAKSDPTVTKLMRERGKNKIIAEEKRLFYVAVTRAREHLILSGTLDGKGNADGWFGWLLDALGIAGVPAEAQIECPVTIEALKGDEIAHISFDLPIRIIKSLDALDFVEEDTPAPPPPIEFPAFHIGPLRPSPAGETFSVTDLLTDAHCPTKFYLKHRLGMPAPTPALPAGGEGADRADGDGTARSSAVHKVLAQLRTKADCERDLEASIHASVASTFGAVSVDTVRAHVHHFLNSEIGGMALNAQESNCEQHIHAQIGPHILNGIIDRLFKDSEGLWHIIDYKTDAIEPSEIAARVNYYRPQIELYALLVHRLYPEQPVIPMTFFFTHLAETYPMQLTAEELGRVEKDLLKRIAAIQEGVFEKNREHCPLCPYFVMEACE